MYAKSTVFLSRESDYTVGFQSSEILIGYRSKGPFHLSSLVLQALFINFDG